LPTELVAVNGGLAPLSDGDDDDDEQGDCEVDDSDE
jgi:hypothetical protein